MKTKNSFITGIVFFLLTCIFNIVCFWFIEDYTNSFWVSIVFGNLSIIMYAISHMTSGKAKRAYLNYQDSISIATYYIICNIVNVCFVLFKMQNAKVNVFVNILVLALYLIMLFIFFSSTATINEQLDSDKKERDLFYDIKSKAELLLNSAESRAINKRLEALYDRISSCQISGASYVTDINQEIHQSMLELPIIISKNDEEFSKYKISAIIRLLDKRDEIITDNLRRNS